MKRVLVTGARGFVGRHTLRGLIERGFEVHAVTRKEQVSTQNVVWHTCDLDALGQTAELVKSVNPTHLLHVAWYVEHGKFWNAQENLRCVQSGIELCRAFLENGGKRLVMAGTCYEYDLSHGWLTEAATPKNPQTLYGIAKDSLRRLVDASTAAADTSFAWGRIFFPYGPYEGPNRLLPSVIGSLLRGEETRCSAGTQIRDFMHVEDVAGGLVALLDSDVSGPVNICSGEPRTIKQVIETVGELLGRPELVRLGDLPMGNQPPFLIGDARRLLDEVQFTPSHTLKNGLQGTIEWWKHQQPQSNR